MPVARPIAERIAEKAVRQPNGCLYWFGWRSKLGYPKIGYQGRTQLVHRISYELANGPIPDGLELDHLCRNPPCIEPAHLEPVTHAVNSRRVPYPQPGKTMFHCGHPMTPENSKYRGAPISGRSLVRCRECYNARERRRLMVVRARRKVPKPPRTHFQCGHAITPENSQSMYGAKAHLFRCRLCKRVQTKRLKVRARLASSATPESREGTE